MSNRGSSTAFRTEIVKDQSHPCHLIEVHFNETHYVTDFYRNITYNGNTYTALGYFLSFDAIEESSELGATTLGLTLSGIGSQYTNELLSQDYVDRTVIIRKAFINDSNALIANPVTIFDGRIDNALINEDAESGMATATIIVSNQFIDFEKVPGRFLNKQNQELYYPGDKGLDYTAEIIKDVAWGREFEAGNRITGSGGLTGAITGASYIDTADVGSWSPVNIRMVGGIMSVTIDVPNRVVIHEAGHAYQTGDIVNIEGATGTTDVPASSINGEHSVTVIDADSYKIAVDEDITVDEDYLGGKDFTIYDEVPPTAGIETQTTTNKQHYVQVIDPTDEIEVGDYIQLENTGAVGGITEEKLTDRAYEVKEVGSGAGAKKAIIEVVETEKTTAPPISTITSVNNTFTVNEADHNRDVGDTVVIAGSASVGGVGSSSINGTKTIAAIKDNDAYNITVTDTVSSTVNYGGGNSVTIDGASPNTPFVATTSGSTTVTFHHTAHGLAVGDAVSIIGCSSVGGIPAEELNTSHTVASVPDANSFTVVVSTTATSTAVGGGAYSYVILPVKATSAARGGQINTNIKVLIAEPSKRPKKATPQ